MLRPRRFWAPFVIVLAAAFPMEAYADTPAKLVVAGPEDDAADKEIEKLYLEGKFDAAFERAEKLVAEREVKFGKEHVRTASAIADLGAMHLAKGNVASAEPLLKRAIEILEKAKDTETNLAVALSNLASVYSNKGDIKRAEAALDRAMKIEEKAGTPRETEYGSLIAKLASIYMKSGRLREAETLFLKAIAIHEKRKAERPLFLDLSNIGTLYRGMGRYDKAADAYNRALPIAERLYGNRHPDVGKLYHVIGIFLTGSNQLDKADEYFGKSEKILLESLGPKHHDVATMYSDWALMLTRNGKIDRALELRDKAQIIEEEWFANALASGTDEDKLMYASQLERSIDRVVSFQMGLGLGNKNVTRFVLRTILRNKARALEATAGSMRALRERMTPENRKRFDDLTRIRGELASRYTRGPRGQTVAEFQAEVDKLARQADAIDAEISNESAAYRQATEEVTLESVAKRIPKDGALFEFIRYRHTSAHFYSAANERGANYRYMGYLLRPNGDVTCALLSGGVQNFDIIVDKVNKLRLGLQNPQDQKFFMHLQLTYFVIFNPFLSQLKDVKHLLISPDGELSLIPFAALIDADGRFLVDNYTISYLSSGRDLLRFGEQSFAASAPMLVANPDYNAPGEANAEPLPDAPQGTLPVLARAKFGSLPGTAEEAEAIRQFVPDPTVKLQRVATETALKQIAGPKILHVATHGFFLDETGKAARGIRGLELDVPQQALPTVKTAAADDDGDRVEILNPMFLSGLALAGANVRKGQMDDGILTAYEASALNLFGTELVVLSACETGVGTRAAREGVRGLRRALVLAGAETQVMSLWQVDDGATRDLMTMYYRNMFQKKLGRSEAMRQAQLALLEQPGRSHPFYWASFIVSGNWAPISGLPDEAPTIVKSKSVTVPAGGAKGCGCRMADVGETSGAAASILAAFVLAKRRRRRSN